MIPDSDNLPGEPQGSILGGAFSILFTTYRPPIPAASAMRPVLTPQAPFRPPHRCNTAAIIHRTKNLYKSFLISAN